MKCLSLILTALLILQPLGPLVLQSQQVEVPIGSTTIYAHSIFLSSQSGLTLQTVSDASSLAMRLIKPVDLSLSAVGGASPEAAAHTKFIAAVRVSGDVSVTKHCQSQPQECTKPHYSVADCTLSASVNVTMGPMSLLTDYHYDLCPSIREGVAEWTLPDAIENAGSEASTRGVPSDAELLSSEESLSVMSSLFDPVHVYSSGIHTEARRSASGETSLRLFATEECAEMRFAFPHDSPSSVPQHERVTMGSLMLNLTLPKDSTVSLDFEDKLVTHISHNGFGAEADSILHAVQPHLHSLLTLLRTTGKDGMSFEVVRDLITQMTGTQKNHTKPEGDLDDEGDL